MPSGDVETICQNSRSASTLGPIAGDDGRVDGADGDSGHPVRMQLGLRQRFVNTRLVGAERAAALKQQRDLFERRALMRQGKPPVTAVSHRNKPKVLAPFLASAAKQMEVPEYPC
jgi:hypothetical protein